MYNKAKILVAQLGARMHYAVPLLLKRQGLLAHLYTDAYITESLSKVLNTVPRAILPGFLKNALGRSCGLPASLVTGFNLFGMRYYWKKMTANTRAERIACHLWAADIFNQLVLLKGLYEAHIVYGFNSASELLFDYCKSREIVCVLEQAAAPKKIYANIVAEEAERWPNLGESPEYGAWDRFCKKESIEWNQADIILGPSSYVVEGLLSLGINPSKCHLVPYGIQSHVISSPIKWSRQSNRLKVLFVGGVHSLKGVQYLILAAKKLSSLIKVRIVGPILCNREHISSICPQNVEVVGRVPRAEMRHHYEWADVFCLPSLCEGSATVIYEALATGVPIVCTPHCGSVIRNGIEGFVVPIRNADAIEDALRMLSTDRDLLLYMASNCLLLARDFTFDKYADRLMNVISSVVKSQKLCTL